MIAINTSGLAIQYINNPTDEMCWTAIMQNNNAIHLMDSLEQKEKIYMKYVKMCKVDYNFAKILKNNIRCARYTQYDR